MGACLFFFLSGGGPGVGPDPVGAQTPTRPEVVSLAFEGNQTFADRVLASAIVTRPTACSSTVVAPFCWIGREFAIDRAFLSPREFSLDYARIHFFYRQQGFREVQVDTVVHRGDDLTVEIEFHIVEGEPRRVTSLEIVGLDGLEEVGRNLPIQEGDRLNVLMLDAARDTIQQRLRNRGYAHVDVLRSFFLPSGSLDAQVEFDVYTGPTSRFGSIEVIGNERVDETVIRRMLPFQEGSVYSQELLFEAQRNLYNLEIFRHAAVVPDLSHQPDSIVPLQVQVNEGDERRVRAGGGWDTADCFSAESRWASRNFMGGARRLVLRGRVSNLLTQSLEESVCSGAGTGVYGELDWLVSTDFTQPWIFSPRNNLSASIYAERQSLQDVFVRQAIGVNLSLSRSLGRASPLTLYYRPQLGRLDAAEIFFCTSFLVCDPLDIDVLQSSNVLAPVGISFSRDRANRAFSPTGGYTAYIELEHAGRTTGSDFEYERALAEGTVYLGVSDDRFVLAGRVRGGWLQAGEFRGLMDEATGSATRIAHPQRRFYAGGANSVRGFSQNQLGPKVLSVQVEALVFPVGGREEAVCTPEEVADLTCDATSLGDGRFFARPTGGSRLMEGNVELRFPIWGSLLGGAAFVDFGRVWNGSNQIALSDLTVTPGFGLRYTTPIGPVRFDVAYRGEQTSRLPVITSQLRPFDPESDNPDARIRSPDGDVLDWIRLEDLATLGTPVLFGSEADRWWNRVQLQFSIGQAF